jgi:AmiR/NasT family two-component response regulator
MNALILTRPGPTAPPLQADLAAAGIHVAGATTRSTLVQDTIRLAPTVLLCHEPQPDDALFEALEILQAHAPLPVILFTNDGDAGRLERALRAGVQEVVVNGYDAARLRSWLHLAQARFRLDRDLRERLEDVTQRFEERKLVDRAKGILMTMRQLPEDEAFKVLRGIAMQGGQRLGEVARLVIDSARRAGDVNRSGQLRMLSQRIVKLQAAAATNTRGIDSAALLQQSLARVEAIVGGLTADLSPATWGDLLDSLLAAWNELQAALAAGGGRAGLARLDAAAESLLQQSETLTAALERASATAPLHVVNLAGRERMLSQRLAKLALLGGDAAEIAATRTQFEQALVQLHAAPLSSNEIRATLAEVDTLWPRLTAALDSATRASGREALAVTSEALLAALEKLTGLYEGSMQVLLG